MTKKLKPHEIQKVTHNDVFFTLFFDRDVKYFYIDIDEVTRVKGDSVVECVKAFRELMKTHVMFKWEPWIEVTVDDAVENNYNGFGPVNPIEIKFHFTRFEIARRGKSLYKRDHPTDWDEDEVENQSEVSVRKWWDAGEDFVEARNGLLRIPYTDERWAELMTLHVGMIQARDRLKKLFTTDAKTLSEAAKNVSKMKLLGPS